MLFLGVEAAARTFFALVLVEFAAFGAVGAKDGAHDEPENQPDHDGRGDGENRVGPEVGDHGSSLNPLLDERKQNRFADAETGQCHEQSIDSHPLTATRGHAVFEREPFSLAAQEIAALWEEIERVMA